MKYPSLQEKYFRALEERDEARKLARQLYKKCLLKDAVLEQFGKIKGEHLLLIDKLKSNSDLAEAKQEIVRLKNNWHTIVLSDDHLLRTQDKRIAQLETANAAWKNAAKYRHARMTSRYHTMRWLDKLGYPTPEQRRREIARARIDKHASIIVDEMPY